MLPVRLDATYAGMRGRLEARGGPGGVRRRGMGNGTAMRQPWKIPALLGRTGASVGRAAASAGRAAASVGEAAARARSALAGHPVRPLHPVGRAFTGQVAAWGTVGDPAWGATVLDRPGRYPAVVRVSKGAGTPPGWPDVLGLAIRLELPGGPFDLLLSSSGRPPGLRHLPLPRRGFTTVYGSLLAYRVTRDGQRRRVYLAALPDPGITDLGRTLADVADAADTPAGQMVLAAADPRGRYRPFAELTLDDPLPDGDDALAFDPYRRHPADLRPEGLVQWLRGAVYRGAQRPRPGRTGRTEQRTLEPPARRRPGR